MGLFDFLKIFKRQKNETNTEFIPPVEEDTECDKCWNLKECIGKGYVIDNALPFYERTGCVNLLRGKTWFMSAEVEEKICKLDIKCKDRVEE